MEGVQEFDSFEEALEYMARATDEANTKLADEQKSVTWGSYWVRFVPDHQLMIFGHVFTRDEFTQAERDAGATQEELDYSLQHYEENLARGYVFGRAYSVWEPRGELGDTHRYNLWPISQANFEEARLFQWVPAAMPGLHTWLRAAYDAYRSNLLSH